MNYIRFREISTKRLLLRQLEDTDDTAIFSLRSDNRVNQFLDRPKPNSIDEARAFISKIINGIAGGESLYWCIALKENKQLIGTICLWNLSADRKTAELGYELHPDHQGKGYMNEAMEAVIDFAFQTAGLSNLEACTHKDNEASGKLLLKHRFELQADRSDPGKVNHLFYTVSKPV